MGEAHVKLRSTPVLAFVAGLLLATGGSAEANNDRHKWWLSDRVRTEIALSEQQSRDIEAIFQAMAPRLRAEKDELDRQEGLLAALMQDQATDEATVTQAIARVERARSAMSTTRTLMLFRMNRVLSEEQRVKLAAYRERRERDRRQGGSDPSVRRH